MNKAKWFWLGLFIGIFIWMYLPMPLIYLGHPVLWLLFIALTIGFFAREFVDWIVKKPWR